MRAASCSSVQITCRPPNSSTPGPSLMSVPRPAMLVETVTLPGIPARATMLASSAIWLAFRTLCSIPNSSSILASISDFSIVRVPIRTGRPSSCIWRISSTTASHFDLGAAVIRVPHPLADTGLVGRNGHDAELVDFLELAGGRARRSGHAADVFIAQEIVLHRDPRRLAGLDRDFHALLGLDRLVNAGPPFATFGEAARRFIDDHDFAVADDIVLVVEEFAGDFDGAFDVLVDVIHADAVHRRGLGKLADEFSSLGVQLDFAFVVVIFVVNVFDELRRRLPTPRRSFRRRFFGPRSEWR